MAATDQYYRTQKTLDVVFGVSCVLLLVTTVWMFAQDYYREFKNVQRTFRDVEASLAEREMVAQIPSFKVVKAKEKAVAAARAEVQKKENEVADVKARLKAQRERQDEVYRNIKADLDSQASYFNIEAKDWADATDPSLKKRLEGIKDRRKAALDRLQADLMKAQANLNETDHEMTEKVRQPLEPAEKVLAEAEDDLKKTTASFDRWAKLASQKTWNLGDQFRALPIIEGFASPTRIQQNWLPDLTIDYGGFKDVPRYDRCITCHLGIDRAAFDKASLAKLGNKRETDALNVKLSDAQDLLLYRAEKGEKLGFDPTNLPREQSGSIGLAVLICLLSSLVAAVSLGALTRSSKVGLATLIIGLVISGGTGAALAFVPSEPVVKQIDLTDGQITQFAGHPRLDLFVDANSPHSAQKFGCTICHGGQGSATDFNLAVHTPANMEQREKWEKEHGWEQSEFWDYPMYSSRFVESGCVKCHHDLDGLIRHGDKLEAPKLLRGYNLVKENGCFGCHEISGVKGGRQVGPDLRLEPFPALEYLSAADQEKARADPLNPPGTLRKVGPALRRLAEKTNQDWTRAWIHAPRDFRPDTKMPHFFELSNNKEDVLPSDQKKFPATEIHAITYYLFTESKGFLKGADTYREFLLKGKDNVAALQKELKNGKLSDRHMKELFDVSRRFADLALISNPTRSAAINDETTRQRQLQERLRELQAKPAPTDADKADITAAGKELDEVTGRLIELARPMPISEKVVNQDGETVTVPAAKGNAANGRRLFTERGCMACHFHQATTKPGEGLPAVASPANHGPDLSRVAVKLKPELGADTARRWLVQWLLNPNVYHTRTRMPVTYLAVEQANDVASWLLDQTGPEFRWDEKQPEKPSTEDLVALARVYLTKAPGMTLKDLNEFLPEKAENGKRPGIPEAKLELAARDADERRLVGEITDEKLLWYVGRKAIARQGCFGCHDIPGFETAKPIGTGLNDWGKKDPERLAFEDAFIWVKEHYRPVEGRRTRKEIESRLKAIENRGGMNRNEKEEADSLEEALKTDNVWEDKNGKAPYEKLFYKALEHDRREGFLHQKLEEPRSYDFNRLKVWDDRLRMPQFKFARSRRVGGEEDVDYHARQEKEEAEAREAVMTFVLGLVADPIPAKYVYNPNPDRLAEIRGREVLDKFNCAGCHQIRPGQYEFKQSNEALQMALASFNLASGGPGNPNFRNDHSFLGHNAWFGTLSPTDRATMVGSLNLGIMKDPLEEEDEKKRNVFAVRLSEAFRFAGPDKVVRDAPAGINLWVPESSITAVHPPFGGMLVDLLRPGKNTDPRPVTPGSSQLDPDQAGYLGKVNPTRFAEKPDDARGALPPPLTREGERVQPDWLYKFLLNPKPIRPEGYMLLRMPRFNMSPEESRALVNYFAATARVTNAGAGITYPYLTIEQKDPDYWQRRTAEYVRRLKDKGQLEARTKAAQPMWEALAKKDLADAEEAAKAAKKVVDDAKDKKTPEMEKALAAADAKVKALKEKADKKDLSAYRQNWESHEAYAQDAFRLLTNKELCLKCHSIGNLHSEAPQGPNLLGAAERLRPGWTEWWIANPVRMFPYSPVMPQNFPNEPNYGKFQELFAGSALEQTRAARDILMDLPRLSDLPAIKGTAPSGASGGK